MTSFQQDMIGYGVSKMLTEKTRHRLLAQIRAETNRLLKATVLCKDVNTPSEIFNAMQKCPKTKQGLIRYSKYAYMMIAVLGYTCAKVTGNKNSGKIFILYNKSLIDKAVLASSSIRDLLINISDILNEAIDCVTSVLKEDMDK